MSSVVKCVAGLTVVVAVLAGVWASTGDAGTRPGIVLDHRIGPVSVGEPRSQVTKSLGRGVPVRVSGNQFRFYRKVGIYVLYPPHPPKGVEQRVAVVETHSPRYETRSGVGVGSSLGQLRQAIHVKCFGYPVPSQCQHGYSAFNKPGTSFLMDHTTKRVKAIAIAYGH